MREAIIMQTARTPLTKAYWGGFNITLGTSLASFSVRAAVELASVDPDTIEDFILGRGYPEGTSGRNIARQTVIRSGLSVQRAGAPINRFQAAGHCHGIRTHCHGRHSGHDRGSGRNLLASQITQCDRQRVKLHRPVD